MSSVAESLIILSEVMFFSLKLVNGKGSFTFVKKSPNRAAILTIT